MNKNIWVIILAGGTGSRISTVTNGISKQFLPYNGRPLYMQSISTFIAIPYLSGIIIVLPEHSIEEESCLIKQYTQHYGMPCIIVKGGEHRQSSMSNGFSSLPKECTHLFIHDAARPFFSAELVQKLLEASIAQSSAHAIIPTIPLTDTIKEIQNNCVVHTPNRVSLVAVQTPQFFLRTALEDAIKKASAYYTDDASLLENAGYTVYTITGDENNIKITTPKDLSMLIKDTQSIQKTVMGYDVHAYAKEGKPLIIGGIHIESTLRILAHSDGDVLLHALIDALLSLIGVGDIGTCFPDTDEKYAGISSCILLSSTLDMLSKHSVSINHIDITLVAQVPLLKQYMPAIRKNIAYLLSLPHHAVSIKATTEEKLGFTGRKEGIKAYALISATVTI